MLTRTATLTLILFLTINSIAEIRYPPTPQFSTPTPITPGQSHQYQHQYQSQPNYHQNPYGSAPQVTNAEQIKQQIQGLPTQTHYGHSRQEYEEILNDLHGSPGYYHPSAANRFNQITPQMRRQRELDEIFKEVNRYGREMSEEEYRASRQYQNDFLHYRKAADQLKEMLEGKRKPSLKEACFLAEAAYGNLPLTYNEYNDIIKENAAFIRQWLSENGYPGNEPEAIHLGIQKFLSDTLYTGKSTDNSALARKAHHPYRYDYIDAIAADDRRNYFVTKTLASGTGQCHTLPVTYLLLAEALNVPVLLAYNPQHSFIQFKNRQGVTLNYETTIDRFLPEQFYLETLPKMANARKNSIYLCGLNKKQVIATVLIDLAVSFVREHLLADPAFIEECLQATERLFPEQSYINNSYVYLKKRLLADRFNRKIKERKIRTHQEIEKHPDIVEDYNRFHEYMMTIEQLGIEEFPEEEYLRMMRYHDEKGKLQNINNPNAKEKKSLFFNY
jgi:hypothetical protein